ncbi:uncharacterized protein YjiS (DUF1127 family) [Paenibacillus shirakamiensis]|uniref:Uncharacterized protein YjiS (DUF1127 family) n=1 Tax=Paenibacillus shirakamiensis TaxID=1265935 RepID=A0ABS4JGF3_9BACL|nr:HEAT repeat domain-containing protein [Paenibacillus shirakamiensis]MBP2000805.1 uncharacterized protein YjiS (DUF1127 family) [Paenibacillus shirakamiensis]
MEEQEVVPVNEEQLKYEALKKSANRTSNWRERLQAVEELGQLDHDQVADVLKARAQNDSVFPIREAAYRQLQKMGVSVPQPKRQEGDLVKGITKLLVRIKKSLPRDHSYEDFKAKLQKMRVDVYDTYEGDKGDEFDTWLEQKWASLRT